MKDTTAISALRQEYRKEELLESTLQSDPISQFGLWFQEALNADIFEPNAMTLATVANGQPSARVVLLKGYDTEGFVFYTNYESLKGKQMAENPYVCLNFWWIELERQVRIEGKVEKVSPETSDAYFYSRPRGSRIGAWASQQSEVIADRDVLANKVNELMGQYGETEEIPRPAHWGGYKVRPHLVEFWQGRPSRLHDRVVYLWESGAWQMRRLAP